MKTRNQKIEHYTDLMSFISKAVGPDFEIALIDVNGDRYKIIAMEYGNISGRHVGEEVPLTVVKAIKNKEYEKFDYIANRTTYTKTGRPLRTSMYFIKDDNGELEGVMCINFDDSRYEELGKKIMHLCHPDEYIEKIETFKGRSDIENGSGNYYGESKTLEESIEAIVDTELSEVEVPVDRLTQEEKIQIVKNLDEKGVFMMKGSVGILAKKLHVSQPSVYRYITMAREGE